MRPDLAERLIRVARVLKLLKKLALTEGEFIERASKRSLEVMKRALGKVELALDKTLSDPAVKDKLLAEIDRLVSGAGVVDQEASQKAIGLLRLSLRTVPQLMDVLSAFVGAAVAASKLQNANIAELAKIDERYQKIFMNAQERLADFMRRFSEHVSKLPDAPEPSRAPEDQQDSSALQGVENQVRDIEAAMRKHVVQLVDTIQQKAEELFPDDPDLFDAIEQNLTAAMPGRKKVNPKLNRDKGFYDDILHMERGSRYDLGEFLTTANKKLMYQAYRSVVMAMRALGVAQWAKTHPDLVLSSQKARGLLEKAQQILQKRSELVIQRLSRVRKEEDEDEDDKGIPRGTFNEYFDNAPAGVFTGSV